MVKNIFIASTSPNTGKSVICLGLINAFRGLVSNVGYFKPIGKNYDKEKKYSRGSLLMKEVFKLDDNLDDINPFSVIDLINHHANEEQDMFIEEVRKSYRKIAKDKDIVVIDGTDYIGMMSILEFNINVDLAVNLDASILIIEDGYKKSFEEIASNVLVCKESFDEQGCDFLGVVVNRIEPEGLTDVETQLRRELKRYNVELFGTVPYASVLATPRLADIAKILDAKVLFGEDYLSNNAKNTIVTGMNIENALGYIRDGTLVITGGDRTDVILGCMASLLSSSYENISGIIMSGDIIPHENIVKLLVGLELYSLPFHIPVLSAKYNTLEIANRIASFAVSIQADDHQKVETGKSLILKHVDYKKIYSKLNVEKTKKRTPDIFKYEVIERARSKKKCIVLPEGDEERTLRAVGRIRNLDIAKIVLLGNPDAVTGKANSLGVNLDKRVEIIEPVKSQKFEEYINSYYELRKHKHITMDLATDLVQDAMYYGTMMLYKGDADGLVSGAIHTTQQTVRPAFEIIKTKPDISSVSSIFFMCLKDRVLVYGDCAIIPKPEPEELADIAISSADTAKAFDIDPYVAMLSYSTGESGTGPEVEKIRLATEIARKKRPDLPIVGPIQYDAAIDPNVAMIKLPDNKVAGKATVFIFPDLNTGNNIYKAVQRSARAIAMGPVLQGLNKPVNDLSRGCSVDDIVYTIAITAIQAQNN